MTAVRRLEGPRPGGTNGERASGKTTKILPLVGRVSRQVRLYKERGRGGGGQTRDGHCRNRRAIERSISRHATRETTGDEPRDSRSVRGAPSPAGTARIERELGRQRPARYPGTPGNKTRDSRKCGGRRLLKPLHQHPSQVLPAAQVKGESTRTTIGSLGRTTGAAWHRPPVSFGRKAGDNRRYWGGDQ